MVSHTLTWQTLPVTRDQEIATENLIDLPLHGRMSIYLRRLSFRFGIQVERPRTMNRSTSITRQRDPLRVRTIVSILFVAIVANCSLSNAQQSLPELDRMPRAAANPIPDPPDAPEPLPSTVKNWQDKPLRFVEASTKPTSGETPVSYAATILDKYGTLFDSIDDVRPWIVAKNFEWDAPATRNLPLFFEEPNLERLGYTQRIFIDACGYENDPVLAEYVQPLISGAKFFGNALTIPYRLGVEPCWEPIYTLGTDRPGSPVPYRKHKIPLSVTGAILQAGVVCPLVFAIP